MQQRLIALAYDATLQPEGWAAFLHEFRLAMRSSGALLMFGDAAGSEPARDIRDSAWHTLTLTRLYYDTFRALNPLDYARMEPGRVYGYEDFVPREAFERSDYYRQYCTRTATEHALVGCFGEPHGARAWLNLSRGADGGAYARRERRLLQSLLPHLERVLKICARLERADAEYRRLREQVDAFGVATLLIDAGARVTVANRAAQALLEGNPGLQLAHGRLGFTEARDQNAFAHALAEVLGPGAARDSASFMVAPHAAQAVSVLLRRLRREDEPVAGRAEAAVYLRPRAGSAPFLRVDHVASLFGLTTTEARLAVLLAEGQSLQQIAQALGITEATARTYCKRVFDKTDTARQADLVRLILTSVVGIGDTG